MEGDLLAAIAVLAITGLGAVGAFAYRAVSTGAFLPTLAPIIKAEPKTLLTSGDARNQASTMSAASSEQFGSRWPTDIQEPPTAPVSTDKSVPTPSPPASGAGAIVATQPAALPSGAPASTPPGWEAKKSHTPITRSFGSRQTETSAAAVNSAPDAGRAGARTPRRNPNATEAPPTENQPLRLAADAQRDHITVAPETKPHAPALPVGRPLSLAPDAHGGATAPPARSRMQGGTGTAAEAASGGRYAVEVASARSAADAQAVFWTLQAKFPNRFGGREPIVRRTDCGSRRDILPRPYWPLCINERGGRSVRRAESCR